MNKKIIKKDDKTVKENEKKPCEFCIKVREVIKNGIGMIRI